MEIIIGRDANTSKLRITDGQRSSLFGANGSVPDSVSREHCSVLFNADDTYVIKNMKAQNVTYVNGIAIETKKVTDKDVVALGSDHYLLEWDFIKRIKPKVADIRPLKRVWDDFKEEKKLIQKRQKNVGLLTSIPMAISMFGGIVTALIPGFFTIAFTVIALIIMIYGFYRRANDKSADEMEELTTRLQRNYSCPNCKRYLSQPYDQLMLMDCCPFCRVKFRK